MKEKKATEKFLNSISELKLKYGIKIICSQIVFILSCILYVTSFFFSTRNDYPTMEIILPIFPSVILVVTFVIHNFCLCRMRKRGGDDTLAYCLFWFYGVGLLVLIPIGALNFVFVGNVRGILLLVACIFGSFGFTLTIPIRLLIMKAYKAKISGQEQFIPLFRRFLEVLLQIALLPMSIFLQVCGCLWFLGGPFLGGAIIKYLFYCVIKKENSEEGYSYNVGASDNVVTTTQTHDIKSYYGKIVGTYETTESHVEHDNGDRYEFSDQYVCACWNSVVALPCRIISLTLSLIAIFVPYLCISAKKPKNIKIKNIMIFRFLDIV